MIHLIPINVPGTAFILSLHHLSVAFVYIPTSCRVGDASMEGDELIVD